MNSKILTWLLNDGLKVLAIVVMAFLVIKIAERINRKTIKVVVKSHRETERIAEQKREETLERIIVGAFVVSVVIIAMEVSGELRKRLKQAFDREGIEIPFPQRVMHQVMS